MNYFLQTCRCCWGHWETENGPLPPPQTHVDKSSDDDAWFCMNNQQIGGPQEPCRFPSHSTTIHRHCHQFVHSMHPQCNQAPSLHHSFLDYVSNDTFLCFSFSLPLIWWVCWPRLHCTYAMQDTNKQAASQNEDPREHRLKLLTTRREALSLYREIMRITALFDWRNEQGMVWYVSLLLPQWALRRCRHYFHSQIIIQNAGGMCWEKALEKSLKWPVTNETQNWYVFYCWCVFFFPFPSCQWAPLPRDDDWLVACSMEHCRQHHHSLALVER